MTTFEKAKQVDILEIAKQGGLKLTKQAGKVFISCPLHSDKTPSCILNQSGKYANTFHCFSCGQNGSVIDFYSILHNIEIKEAARILAGENNFIQAFPIRGKIESFEAVQPPDIHSDIFADFILFCKSFKATGQKASVLDYLHKRGFNNEAIKAGKLFAVPLDLEAEIFLKQTENQARAMAAGLITSKGKFAFAEYPLLIPSIDPDGKVCNIQGRRIDGKDKVKGGPPKYRYLAGVKKYPYGLHTLHKSGPVLLCEGALDAIALTTSDGFPAIAFGGLSIPALLFPFLQGRNIALCLDNDKAGIENYNRLRDSLEAAGIKNVFKAELLDKTKKDPAEAMKATEAGKLALMIQKNKSLKALIDTFRLTIEK